VVKLLRLFVLTVVVASWQVTPVLAESLLQSGARLARQAGRELPLPVPAEVRRSAVAEQAPVAESGMSKRKKLYIAIGAFVAAAVGIYAIERGVEDNTPSSKGTRKD
jgi:hypothetical protein